MTQAGIQSEPPVVNVGKGAPAKTKAEEIKELQAEIGRLQMRLHYLILGDPAESVSIKATASNVPRF